jgi:hypothetical protein
MFDKYEIHHHPTEPKLHDPMEAFRNACQKPNLTIAQAMAFHNKKLTMRNCSTQSSQKQVGIIVRIHYVGNA